MNTKIKDIAGQRFGRLVAIRPTQKRYHNCVVWQCECDCGSTHEVSANRLISGNVKSCGCLQREVHERFLKMEKGYKTHGMSSTRIYNIWQHMKKRCNNPKISNYKDYGGRGIKVFDEWNASFESFYNYVSQLPHYNEKGYSIDRINNNGNYEPGNIRWATRQEQNSNKRNCIYYDFCGKKYTPNQIFYAIGVPTSTIRWRHQRGRDLLNEREMLRFVEYLKNMEERNGVKS